MGDFELSPGPQSLALVTADLEVFPKVMAFYYRSASTELRELFSPVVKTYPTVRAGTRQVVTLDDIAAGRLKKFTPQKSRPWAGSRSIAAGQKYHRNRVLPQQEDSLPLREGAVQPYDPTCRGA